MIEPFLNPQFRERESPRKRVGRFDYPLVNFTLPFPARIFHHVEYYRPRGCLIEVAHVWRERRNRGRKTAVKPPPPPPPYKAFHGYQFSRRMMLASKLGAETGRMALGRAVWAGERDKSIRQTIINVAGGFALIVDTRLFDILVSLFPLLFSSLSLSLSLAYIPVSFQQRDDFLSFPP